MRIDAIVYTNRLRRLTPGMKVAFAAVLMALASVSHIPVLIAIFLWMSVWIVVYAKIPFAVYMRLVGPALAFLLLGLPPLMIEIAAGGNLSALPEDAVMSVSLASFQVYASARGMAQAGLVLCRSLACLSCLYFLLLTVPFAEMLQTMRRVRMPAVLLEIALVMHRFLFVLLESSERVRIAQQAREGHKRFRNRIRDASLLVAQLFRQTLFRYRQLSVGLAARGFAGDLQVLSTSVYEKSMRHVWEAIVGCCFLLAFEWWLRR